MSITLTRWQAFAVHLALSVLVFVSLTLVIANLWFPGILFSIDGGWNGLKLVTGVDVMLGPILTLVVFKPGKPGLKFDLVCIGLAQVACLAAGIWIVQQARPLALVLAYDTVYSLGAKEFATFGKDTAVLADFPGAYPKLLYVTLSENEFTAEVENLRSQFIGDPLFMQTERYQALPVGDVEGVFRWEDTVRRALGERASELSAPDGCHVAYFVSPYTNGAVCFDSERRELSQFVPLGEKTVE